MPKPRRRTPTSPPPPVLVRAVAQANVGGLRRGQVVDVFDDDPRLGHYLLPVDDGPVTLLGVTAGPADGDGEAAGAEPG